MAGQWDIRSIPKAEQFSGNDQDWNEWAFSFRSYVYVLGLAELVEQAGDAEAAPESVDMSEEVRPKGEMLYHVLVQLLKGKARRIAMTVERGNGFKLWWELRRAYESHIPGRHQSMLMSLLKPEKWANVKSEDFEVSLLEWELDIQRYEQQSGKTFDDDHKVATVLRWSPTDVKNSMMAGDPANRESYQRARSAILMLLRSRTVFSSQGTPLGANATADDPMQVDAAMKAKGKKGGKGKMGKGGLKGKFGKDKSKSKNSVYDKFNGYCNGCKKWGHKRANCWTNPPGGKGGDGARQVDAAAKQHAPPSPGSAGGTQVKIQKAAASRNFCSAYRAPAACRMCAYPIENDEVVINDDVFHAECSEYVELDDSEDYHDDGEQVPDDEVDLTPMGKGWTHVMAVRQTGQVAMARDEISLKPGESWILWDTGADEHLSRPKMAEGWPTWKAPGPGLVDVQNNSIKDYGMAEVILDCVDFCDKPQTVKAEFRVTDVNENVMSAGKTIRSNAFRAILDKEGNYLECKKTPNIKIPLYLRRSSFYMKVRLKNSNKWWNKQNWQIAAERYDKRGDEDMPSSGRPRATLAIGSGHYSHLKSHKRRRSLINRHRLSSQRHQQRTRSQSERTPTRSSRQSLGVPPGLVVCILVPVWTACGHGCASTSSLSTERSSSFGDAL